MDLGLKAQLFYVIGKGLSQFLRYQISRSTFGQTTTITATPARLKEPDKEPAKVPQSSTIILPSSSETTKELKRRLSKELYRAELDLANGLKIAGKPCDCLEHKHTLMLEAAAEELVSQDPDNTVYQDIIGWIDRNKSKVSVEAIAGGQYSAEYSHMANQFKDFRKRVLGTAVTNPDTVNAGPLTLEQAKKLAAEEAQREVEKVWDSQLKK